LKGDYESADWGVDPESGARVMRLTSAAAWSHNIYGEQPYASPDGRRLLVARAHDTFAGRQLLVADMVTRGLTLVEADIPSESVAHSSWSEWAYYVMYDGSLRRLSLLTLERQLVCPPGTLPVPPQANLQTITPDDRWLLYDERRDTPGFRSIAFDLRTGERRVLNDSSENLNTHAQAELGAGGRWLYQLIRQGKTTAVPVFVQPLAGGEPVQLPIGDPWSAESSGHMAWVGATARVAVAVAWEREAKRHDPRHAEGNLLIAAPGDRTPMVFPAPQYAFYHVSISRCGRYFVCDEFMDFRLDGLRSGQPGPVRIVVGNLDTGKCRALLRDCQNHGIAGTSRYEPDPYFTADNRYVIYNASPFGLMQVFAAEVPEEFWRSLE
jgi:hypothetical protein